MNLYVGTNLSGFTKFEVWMYFGVQKQMYYGKFAADGKNHAMAKIPGNTETSLGLTAKVTDSGYCLQLMPSEDLDFYVTRVVGYR